MESVYSIAICPPDDIFSKVAEYKIILANAIGWYANKSSKAHIPLTYFLVMTERFQSGKSICVA